MVSELMNMLGTRQDVAFMLGGHQFTGKNFIVRDVSMTARMEDVSFIGNDPTMRAYRARPGYDIDIGLTSFGEIMFESLEGALKVSDKKVRDATIPELLFAVRKKIENGG